LVGAETEEDGENVDETRSESSSFEEETRPEGISIMGNANARVSQLDLHPPTFGSKAESAKKRELFSLSYRFFCLEYRQLIVVSQGTHSIFVVIPQFLTTGLLSFIFAISEPDVLVLPGHKLPAAKPAGNTTLSRSENAPEPAKPVGTNSVAIIFRYLLFDRLLAQR
jgi:hypothetical protein